MKSRKNPMAKKKGTFDPVHFQHASRIGCSLLRYWFSGFWFLFVLCLCLFLSLYAQCTFHLSNSFLLRIYKRTELPYYIFPHKFPFSTIKKNRVNKATVMLTIPHTPTPSKIPFFFFFFSIFHCFFLHLRRSCVTLKKKGPHGVKVILVSFFSAQKLPQAIPGGLLTSLHSNKTGTPLGTKVLLIVNRTF